MDQRIEVSPVEQITRHQGILRNIRLNGAGFPIHDGPDFIDELTELDRQERIRQSMEIMRRITNEVGDLPMHIIIFI